MSEKSRKIETEFIPVRYEWLPLLGYPCPVINADGNVSTKSDKPQTRRVDYVDLLLLSEISGYGAISGKDCFASPATLAAAVGLYGKDDDMTVVKRLAGYAASGIISVSYKEVMGQKKPQLVYKVNFSRIKELCTFMEEQRKFEKVDASPRAKILRASRTNEKLQDYIQNYIEDYSPDYNQTTQKTTDETTQKTIYETIHQTNQIDGKLVEKEVFQESRVDRVESVCMSRTKEDQQEREEAETFVSVSSTGKEELPPWVNGGFASLRDIFEHGVKPFLDRGGTYWHLNNIVEEITGKRQKIKDISNPADQQAVYEKLIQCLESGEMTEQKKQAEMESIAGSGKIAEIFDVAKRLIDEYEWTWAEIGEVVAEITGKEQKIKDITPLEDQKKVYDALESYLKRAIEQHEREVMREEEKKQKEELRRRLPRKLPVNAPIPPISDIGNQKCFDSDCSGYNTPLNDAYHKIKKYLEEMPPEDIEDFYKYLREEAGYINSFADAYQNAIAGITGSLWSWYVIVCNDQYGKYKTYRKRAEG